MWPMAATEFPQQKEFKTLTFAKINANSRLWRKLRELITHIVYQKSTSLKSNRIIEVFKFIFMKLANWQTGDKNIDYERIDNRPQVFR